MDELIKYAQEVIAKHPQLKRDILDFVQLAQDEIDDGGSTDHEVQLCRGSIEELIEGL